MRWPDSQGDTIKSIPFRLSLSATLLKTLLHSCAPWREEGGGGRLYIWLHMSRVGPRPFEKERYIFKCVVGV